MEESTWRGKVGGHVIGDGVAELIEKPNVGDAWVEVATRMALRYLYPA